ncbi:hypothetical protein GOBAR_DD17910 [Gossypium barbadense]|nr:hypothetical protein GOBAR_DD17910 [Gossypium barbadense]
MIIYDVTIGYKHRCPSFLDNVFGVDPSEVHIHIRRVTLDDIPLSESEVFIHKQHQEVLAGKTSFDMTSSIIQMGRFMSGA